MNTYKTRVVSTLNKEYHGYRTHLVLSVPKLFQNTVHRPLLEAGLLSGNCGNLTRRTTDEDLHFVTE